MGRLQLSEFRTRLQKILGNRGFSSGDLEDWIHDGLFELSGAMDFPQDEELETSTPTVDGTASYALPADLMAIKAVKVDEEQRLLRIEYREYLKKDQTADEGVPELYARLENKIYLYPIPDDAYDLTILYHQEPAVLSNDTDTTEYPAQWDRAILLFAAHHAHIDLGENARANDFLRRASIYVRSRRLTREREAEAPTERGVNIALDKSDLKGLET